MKTIEEGRNFQRSNLHCFAQFIVSDNNIKVIKDNKD